MKSNNNYLDNKLLFRILKQYILKVFLLAIFIPITFAIIFEIITRLNFEWLYNFSPDIYLNTRNIFDFITSVNSELTIIGLIVIWAIGCIILSYRLIKKLFSYINEITIAANNLLDKNTDYIELSPELEYISVKLNKLKHEYIKNENKAKEIEQKKNDLIVYLAHDLKTPLTSIIGYLELLKETDDLPLKQRSKYINITLDKAYRLEDLMNEFFEIAKFNDINIVLMKKDLNIKLMLQQIIDEFFPMTNEQNKQIIINCDDNITCFADPDKLSRVFNNVIKNAISYSFENTKILIDVSKENDKITIIIQNEGYTIPEEKLNTIFEKFYRLDTSRATSNGGAGLGLAIAKEIITLHNGNICAKSKDNITKFILTLPEK